MLESIMASLIANIIWDEIKIENLDKKLDSIQETIIDKNNELKWIIAEDKQ
tara:strand:+ start:240 stop:392 length:153 start_codon:yes stop_codon:yes gene_type:complete